MVEGYKHTEIGVIPKDWVLEKFKNVTNTITCGVAATPKYVSPNIGKPFLSASHVQNGKVLPNNIKYIKKELFNQITKHNKPKKGDILYTRVGAGIGEAGVIDFKLDFAIYVSLTLIKPKALLNNYYLKFLLNSNRYKSIAKGGQFAGGGVQNLNVEVVREFLIPLPPLREQQDIAEVLSDIDALITALEKRISKKRLIKQGAMQTLLTPQPDWEVKKLGVVAEIYQPKTISQEAFTKDGYLVYGANGIVGKYKQYNHKSWQTIITCRGSTCGTVNKTTNKCWITGNAMVINIDSNPKLMKTFFYYLLKKQDYINCITGSGQPQIVREPLLNFEITIPSLPQQTRIATILSDMDSEIDVLEKKLSKTKELKQGLMQQLLTGKIRLA